MKVNKMKKHQIKHRMQKLRKGRQAMSLYYRHLAKRLGVLVTVQKLNDLGPKIPFNDTGGKKNER